MRRRGQQQRHVAQRLSFELRASEFELDTQELVVEDLRRLLDHLEVVRTTVAGFSSFLTMDVEPMRSFGLQASIGVSLCAVAALLVMPAAAQDATAVDSDHYKVVVENEHVSGEHLELRKTADGWEVIDLDSTNGTWVNGEKKKEADLKNGDIIRGGKTAMRVPPLVTNYCLSICSGDFNDWVWKCASTLSPYSYVRTPEYEIFEFNLGSTFNYSEMAALIAPRPFMVERGHFDGVADDWPLTYEHLEEFYDLSSDPKEMRNLIGDPAARDTLADMRRELDRLMSEAR